MSLHQFLHVVLLGALQGIAEFLPISSSGHLVIFGDVFDRWLQIDASDAEKLQLNVALHIGTLVSIAVVYRRDLLELRTRPKLCLAIVLATIPAAVLGLLFKDFFERVFATPLIAGFALYITAALLLAGQRWERNQIPLEDLTLGRAGIIGLFQAGALIPGISRSGSTIVGGLLMGCKRETAATFSFLIAVPVIGGAGLLEGIDMVQEGISQEAIATLAVGAVVSFAVGVASLRWLLRLISLGRLHWFAYYCIAVATLTVGMHLLQPS